MGGLRRAWAEAMPTFLGVASPPRGRHPRTVMG
jgi:hypothetical protein